MPCFRCCYGLIKSKKILNIDFSLEMEHLDDIVSVQTHKSKALQDISAANVKRTERKQKFIIWKNVILISMSFSVTFMAFQSLQNIQSSLNSTGGLGVASLSVSYTFTVLTGIFVTSLIISRKGCKWTLIVSTFCYIGYAAANFYPAWLTLIPAAVIVGKYYLHILPPMCFW